MNDYEERKQKRIDRYRTIAEKLNRESEARFNSPANQTLMLTPGQPILIGHHSEKRHRRLIDRAQTDTRKGIEAMNKAEHYQHRAEAAGKNSAVYSDDPEALVKLRRKLESLELRQAHMKRINAAHRRFMKNPGTLHTSDLSDAEKENVKNYVPRYSWEPHPYPPYALTNNNANIKRVRDRIAGLELEESAPDTPEREIQVEGDSVRVFEDDGRVQFEFPGKPSANVRSILKSEGFKWSPSRGTWVRQATSNGRYATERVISGLQR